jgi:hypothetical protein
MAHPAPNRITAEDRRRRCCCRRCAEFVVRKAHDCPTAAAAVLAPFSGRVSAFARFPALSVAGLP